MSDQQVRDEVLTLLVAGHETTANALCWTLLLLAQHPHIEARLILATILPRYQFRLLPETNVVPEPLVTLRPRGKLLMTIHNPTAPL